MAEKVKEKLQMAIHHPMCLLSPFATSAWTQYYLTCDTSNIYYARQSYHYSSGFSQNGRHA
eukprot:6194556-Pleurochrysis_carterae.AAC.3